ncbi:chitin synthase activator, partial [Teratosphaeria destructans]
MTTRTSESGSSGDRRSRFLAPRTTINRPVSAYTFGSDRQSRAWSPIGLHGSSDAGSPRSSARDLSSSRRSPLGRPVSYIDLLNNVPHHQQIAPGPPLNNADLQGIVGSAASLLDTKQTLDMYRANVKRTTDAAVQYEFAVFMVNAARDAPPADDLDHAQLYAEAKHILQRLSDRAYPFAQYYLGDGYFSGLFNKNRPDYDKAFPLFVRRLQARARRGRLPRRVVLRVRLGHDPVVSEGRAVLPGARRGTTPARPPGSASPASAATVGLVAQARVSGGRSSGSSAPPNPPTSSTRRALRAGASTSPASARTSSGTRPTPRNSSRRPPRLGHVRANFAMGEAYESGLYSCPRDAALSVHFYTGAATRGLPEAMMALCAWYMLGAPPVLDRDEAEAYAWATLAAEAGLVKAEYACGYFTEMGIGCRRDPLQANVWYVSAAESGSEQARQRLRIISQAANGMPEGVVGVRMEKGDAKTRELGAREKKRFMGIF